MTYRFTDPEQARLAIKDGIEFLIDEDGYSTTDIRDNLIEPLLGWYEDDGDES